MWYMATVTRGYCRPLTSSTPTHSLSYPGVGGGRDVKFQEGFKLSNTSASGRLLSERACLLPKNPAAAAAGSKSDEESIQRTIHPEWGEVCHRPKPQFIECRGQIDAKTGCKIVDWARHFMCLNKVHQLNYILSGSANSAYAIHMN